MCEVFESYLLSCFILFSGINLETLVFQVRAVLIPCAATEGKHLGTMQLPWHRGPFEIIMFTQLCSHLPGRHHPHSTQD